MRFGANNAHRLRSHALLHRQNCRRHRDSQWREESFPKCDAELLEHRTKKKRSLGRALLRKKN